MAQNSVLSTGDWYKIGITEEGIYQLGYNDLVNLGINPANLDPRDIRIYGNGGGMLPEPNASSRPDDLLEIAITVEGENDGVFDLNDYIMFYGQAQHRWHYNENEQRYYHELDIYADTTFYFLKVDTTQGKRISLQSSSTQSPTKTVTAFDDFTFRESEQFNLIQSGREWYGDHFTNNSVQSFSFTFPNRISSDSVHIKTSFAARSTSQTSTFDVAVNGQLLYSHLLNAVPGSYTSAYARASVLSADFITSDDTINTSIDFTTSNSGEGWLDYIELQARRQLTFAGSQMDFRDTRSVGIGNITDFMVTNTSATDVIWEVTDHQNVKEQETVLSGDTSKFRLSTDSLRKFIIFDGSSFLSPALYGPVPNQNLHGLGTVELLIITAPEFLSAANTLANHHQNFDGLSVEVVTTSQIYNEFSSGAQDLAAIRDFIKMIYDNSQPADSLRYVLLFGEASYDYKNVIPANTNFVPTYQSPASLEPISTFASDDFFGFLEDSEGSPFTGDIDVGIGRLPVKTLAEANEVVDKIIHYTGTQTLGKWRKEVTFIGDDEDGNLYLSQADDLASYVDEIYCDYNVEKVFLDAFPEIIDSTGQQRYPAVATRIRDKVFSGTLLMNYTGFANATGWAYEKVLQKADIDNWGNIDKLPLFVCVSAEFNVFDDAGFVSTGEALVLKNNGGGIASFGSTRLIFASANATINRLFTEKMSEPVNGEMPRMGDIVKRTKRNLINNANLQKTVLIGDPALRLAYPQHEVVTMTVNGNTVGLITDTLIASTSVTIEGQVQDVNGTLLSGFNGILYADLFDKQITDTTLGNGNNLPTTYQKWRQPVLMDSTTVTNGTFTFVLNVPAGVDSTFGFGKISLYADDGQSDASGCYENFVIGGGNQTIASIESNSDEITFLIYPSPVIGQATVELRGFIPKSATFCLYDNLGRQVKKMEDIAIQRFSFSSENLSQGIYLYTFTDRSHRFKRSGKLMIR